MVKLIILIPCSYLFTFQEPLAKPTIPPFRFRYRFEHSSCYIPQPLKWPLLRRQPSGRLCSMPRLEPP